MLWIYTDNKKSHLIIYSILLLFTFKVIIFIIFFINDFFIQIIFLIIIIFFLTFYQKMKVSIKVSKYLLFPDSMLTPPTPALHEQ